MSNLSYALVALFMAAVLAWQLVSGTALGSWWIPRAARRDNPGTHWVLVAIQGAILIAFLMTGKTWHLRWFASCGGRAVYSDRLEQARVA
jgi:hypothetical protein